MFILGGFPTTPLGTPTAEIRARLAGLPQCNRYADQVDASLALLDRCRAWLTDDVALALCHAAYSQNDSIYQHVSFASPATLADEVRRAARRDTATDMQAITAFALGCCFHALHAIGDCLQGNAPDEIAALDLFRTYFDAIAECVTSAGVWLAPDECEACNELGDMAGAASKLADFKAWGHWGESERQKQSGESLRDQELRKKALELIRAGTRFHNLNSKLRVWQEREYGYALTKPAMGVILQRLGLSLAPGRVNRSKR